MKIKCLLWDFGDTLCDERFIWSSGPDWEKAYCLFDDGWADDWNTGRIGDLDFAQRLTGHIRMNPQAILAHMHERCRHVAFYDYTYAYFRAKHLPQAIVTVNPRLWSEVIAPLYSMEEAADAIVTSWEEGTTHKGILCNTALDRLPGALEPADSLLIDNRLENVDAWRSEGGCAYLYKNDEQFRQDVSSGLDALAA